MKAHRFKTRLTTEDEVWTEFNTELQKKIDYAIHQEIGNGAGIIKFFEYKESHEGIKLIAAKKLELMKAWEVKGRNLAFLKNKPDFYFMDLLSLKYYGIIK